ncbi:1108_t:CDS:1, partial [Acaulospora morrowiae]
MPMLPENVDVDLRKPLNNVNNSANKMLIFTAECHINNYQLYNFA